MPSLLSRDVKKVALALCHGLAGSRSAEFKKLITEELWDDLVNSDVRPSSYADAESYFSDVATISFLRKYESLPTRVDKKARAYVNFWSAEHKCYRTNQRLLPFIHNTFACEDEAVHTFIKSVRSKVEELIGERPPANPEGRFGPGSTFGDRGGFATLPDKMTTCPQITHDAWPYLVPWSSTLWAKAAASRDDSITFLRGSRFTTVPKDAKQDRGISIEPSLNIFYQLAYGTAMRRALEKRTAHRVCLDTMQEIHRQVAREASLTGAFATIDLSQASDTICSAFVKLCVPRRWYEVLDDLRSKTITLSEGGKSKTVVLEKFSAMGNGYTFELETVLFMAVCMAVMEARGITPKPGINVYVFGDDIIVPTEVSGEVIAALRFLGMDTNESKSFVTGPFRESCGGDYFRGVDVRPYFLKKEVNEPQHYVAMANGIRRLGNPDDRYDHRWPRVMHAWFACLDSIPEHVKSCRGPSGLGDICIHDLPATWNSKWKDGIRYIRTYGPHKHRTVKWDLFSYDVQLATACYGISLMNNGVTQRDSVISYANSWVPYS